MKPLEKIDPELFVYELYDASGIEFMDCQDITKYAIGYCDADRLFVKPKSGEFALMCEMQGDKLWFYIDKSILDIINERRGRLYEKQRHS